MAVPVSELQSIAPSSIIELFELQLNTTQHGTNSLYRFHAGVNLKNNGDVVWNGNTYLQFPIEADGFEYSGNGQLPRPKIRVSNILSTITTLLLTLPSGLEGAVVTRIRTLARYIDAVNFPGDVNPYGTPDPTAEFPREVYYVDRKSIETRDVVEFELAASFDLAGVRAPKRQCISNICQWVYRSAECGYAGNAYFDANGSSVATLAQDVCGKRLSDCKLRFERITSTGNVTSGSNILTLDSPFGVDAGQPISGFGVPAGATVSSSSGASITMSVAATATSSLSKSGVLQANRTQIVLSDASGLAVGMIVSGPKIQAGTTIASISGNTITLGQAVGLIDVVTLSRTVSGELQETGTTATGRTRVAVGNKLKLSSLTGLAVGMYVAGPTITLDKNATITLLPSRNVPITLSYAGTVAKSAGSYKFYAFQTQTTQTYSFVAPSRNYTLRGDSGLPFGSFPGVGTYIT